MTLVGAALAAAAAELRAAGVADPATDARRLMAAALGVAPARLTLVVRERLEAAQAAEFARMLAARARRQPVAQILGRRVFWGRDFIVTPDVLDPRPETETLVARALDGSPPARLLDLGTGSGVLLVSLLCEWPRARGTGCDVSEAALAVAARNAAAHGVAARATLKLADWGEGIAGGFDVVVCNPPYIAAAELACLAPDVRDWEPHAALSPGPTGLESYAAIAARLPSLLAPVGRALFEIGEGQAGAVTAIFAAVGFGGASVHRDFDGRDRVVCLRRSG